MSRDELRAVGEAYALTGYRMRVSLVSALTGVSAKRVRAMWHEVHGEGPRNGKLPAMVLRYIESKSDAQNISAFSVLHWNLHGGMVLNATALARSLDAAKEIGLRMDANAAYFAVRDLHEGRINLWKCRHCAASFLQDVELAHTRTCPFC